MKSFLGYFYRLWRFFTGHTDDNDEDEMASPSSFRLSEKGFLNFCIEEEIKWEKCKLAIFSNVTIIRNGKRLCSGDRDQCDLMLKSKLAQSFTNVAPKVAASVFTRKVLFSKSLKSHHTFGLILKETLTHRISKNCPIWSHWSRVTVFSRKLLWMF